MEKTGDDLFEGLTELWVRHLFETVRPDGQRGFSSFHLQQDGGRIVIDGDREGMRRLRQWVFGSAEVSHHGYFGEADCDLLSEIVAAHIALMVRGEHMKAIATAAATAPSLPVFHLELKSLMSSP